MLDTIKILSNFSELNTWGESMDYSRLKETRDSLKCNEMNKLQMDAYYNKNMLEDTLGTVSQIQYRSKFYNIQELALAMVIA